ncbi:hypothetical protein QBC36DRAFT_334743, partial [Triangularia setosa]
LTLTFVVIFLLFISSYSFFFLGGGFRISLQNLPYSQFSLSQCRTQVKYTQGLTLFLAPGISKNMGKRPFLIFRPRSRLITILLFSLQYIGRSLKGPKVRYAAASSQCPFLGSRPGYLPF